MNWREQMFTPDSLAHYGVPGMKWGVRKNRTAQKVTVQTTPGRKVKTSGGQNQKPTQDAITAAKLKQKAKKSTTDALTNKELQAAVTRMNLEQQYRRLSAPQKSKGKQFLDKLLGTGKTANDVIAFRDSKAGQELKDALKKK